MSHRAGASTAIRWVATSSLVMLLCGRGAVAVQTPPDATGRLRSSPAAQMLTRYADGDDRSARTFAFQPNKAAAVRAFRDDVRDWIAEGGAQTNRSALAATFALDVVRQWAGTPDWAYAPALLAWGCGHVGAGSSAWSGERIWHLAAVAVAQTAEDWALVIGQHLPSGKPMPVTRNPTENERRQGHLRHARARFPDEPRLMLAEAIAAETLTWEAGGPGRDLNHRFAMMAGEIDPAYLQSLRAGQVLASDGSGRRLPGAKPVAARALAQIADLQRLKEQYRALVGYPTVAAEALVRLALIEFRFAEREQALEHLALAVTLSRDPHVTYLAHLVTGTIHERQAAPAQAIDAYRAALNLYPRAHSATSLLIARLFQTGARAEAAALAEDLFLEGGPAPDPWRAYRLGDQRLLPEYFNQMRAALR